VATAADAIGSRAVLELLGTTVEGRPIPVLRVAAPGRTPDRRRPQAMVLGGIHGCEVIATELALDLALAVCAEAPDDAVAAVLDVADVVVVPTLNIDGRVASLRSLADRGIWNPAPRRNAHGVDLNRNFPVPPGAVPSRNPLSGTSRRALPWYRGPAPFSEPESRALATLAEQVRPFVLLNLHSTGTILTYPWGSRPEPPADEAGFLSMIEAFTAAQPHVTYGSKQSRAWYPILGASNDWFHDRFATLALTVEVSPPAAEVKRDTRLGRWFFWFANPIDRDRWVANDLPGCWAALAAAHAYRQPIDIGP